MNMIQKFWNENGFLNHVLFSKHIDKCKKEGLKNYLSSIFLLKNIFLKIFIFIILCALVLGLGFGLREHYIQIAETNNFWKNGNKIVELNPGIAFSGLANAPSSVIYFIQALPCAIALVAILFINKWWIYLGFILMFWGGMMNIIDRSLGGMIHFARDGEIYDIVNLKGKVIDYFPAPTSTFNIADVFIIMGVSMAGVAILAWAIMMFIKENKNEKLKEKDPNFKPKRDMIDEIMDEYEELRDIDDIDDDSSSIKVDLDDKLKDQKGDMNESNN